MTVNNTTFNGGSIAWTVHRLAAAIQENLFLQKSHQLSITVRFVGAVQPPEDDDGANPAALKSGVTWLSQRQYNTSAANVSAAVGKERFQLMSSTT
ncbi:hypothetical protein NDA00_09240 [Funiculus sociatus GB2-M2]|uniref:hypothetical protein n=1 Tax=Cyanophyceae TaxID=3028117 RepID=UPI001F5499C4|nr:hypothetical protein [Trichocoleus sp. FACHB-90]